eukprot:103806-Prymnesium_polylepis.1
MGGARTELIARRLVHEPAAQILGRCVLGRHELRLLVGHLRVLVVVLERVDNERVRLVKLVAVGLLDGG